MGKKKKRYSMQYYDYDYENSYDFADTYEIIDKYSPDTFCEKAGYASGKHHEHSYYRDDKDDYKKKKKKEKEDNEYEEYDYSEINADEYYIRKKMKAMANSFEEYIDCIDTYAIFDGISEEEWKKHVKRIRKLIKKLRKGDPSVFDIPTLNEVLSREDQLVVGLQD